MTTLPELVKWLARDEDGELWAYSDKPVKKFDVWDVCDYSYITRYIEETDDTFSHVKWTDEEPTKIKRGMEKAGVSMTEYERMTSDKTHDYDSERYEKHRNLVDDLHKMYVAKNKDYGNSFGESVDEFGIIAGVIRIGDKYNRLKTLAKGHDPLVNDESMIDTLKDMANYCLLTIIELEEVTE